MAKRGRKRKNEKYFDEDQEIATLQYLKSTDEEERRVLYEFYLKEPFIKMAEAIINRYNLQCKEMSFDEQLNDTISFLHTKIEKYEPGKGRAYSYFGTIIRNRNSALQKKERRSISRKESYDTVSTTIEEDEKFSYQIDEYDSFTSDFFVEFSNILEEIIVSNENSGIFKEDELKIGYGIIEIMKNSALFFDSGGGRKFEKNRIIECLRNLTGLDTDNIRTNLKKFKKLYFIKKQERMKKNFNCDDSAIKNTLPNFYKKK
jgi:hypothetical protein